MTRSVMLLRRFLLTVAVLGAVVAVATVPASAAPAPGDAESQFFASLNGERTRAGLAPLSSDPAMRAIAVEWSTQMANENRLYHRSDLRAQVESRVTTSWLRIGENVGTGYDVPGLHAAFMASPSHKANVVGDYNRLGVGVVVRGEVIWVTFNFLKGPALAAPSPPVYLRTIDRACPASMPLASFGDVAAGDVHSRAINCMAWWEVAGGISRSAFFPAGRVNRAQMASFVARAMEATGHILAASPPDAFDDDTGSVHERRINQLAAAGVVGGVTRDSFRPGDAVTRGQMATFLVRSHDVVSTHDLVADGSRFGDDSGSVHEASIDKSAAAGLAGGTTPGAFSPLDPVSRGQLTSFLARTLDLLVAGGEATTP